VGRHRLAAAVLVIATGEDGLIFAVRGAQNKQDGSASASSAIKAPMSQTLADLPNDIEALRTIIVTQARQLAEQAERLVSRETLIEKLRAQLAVLKRARYGASSEKVDRAIAQLELALEDIEAAAAETAPVSPIAPNDAPKARPARAPLPDHLPHHDVLHEAGDCTCLNRPGFAGGSESREDRSHDDEEICKIFS
jgi:hypothetical protein